MSGNKRSLDTSEDTASKRLRSTPDAQPTQAQSVQDKLAAAKARVAKLTASWSQPNQSNQSNQEAAPKTDLNSAIAKSRAEIARKTQEMKERTQSRINPNADAKRTDIKAPGSGLGTASHPLLATLSGSASPANVSANAPKFTSIKANKGATPAVSSNPYLQDQGEDTNRRKRQFVFSRPGKYIAQADAVRNEAKLEELKRKIDENARKAGITGESEAASERAVKRPPPPAVEWWDQPLLHNQEAYPEDLNKDAKIETEDSLITLYVQHPIPIPAPHDRSRFAKLALKLTKKEMKKMRKQRRQAELSDKRDRIKMGLLPPDPPKVKLSNLMRVLASDAIQDPTKVEAKVRRDMQKRKIDHERMNEENKLTKEQRHEKDENKRLENEKARGTRGAVFKIKNMSNPSHQFKVRKNAQQHGLSGCWLQNEKFHFIYVEGSEKSMKAYKRLMTVRIDWTEETRGPTNDEGEEQPQSLADNYCHLIWEGPTRDRLFNRFITREMPSDREAKEFLGESLAGYWDTAKVQTVE
ncbi:Pre-mRNA-splicing factor 3 [Wallemia mellicola]|uniref:Pre-mRNA-splicing factor 3 n=1 Tax=Wallemia mellicola TaxID=1708541 RepID=A0A4T0M1N9_9BASI|nr:Pre-mRNA-splicing factor 3 [Wallemia mellicola]